MNHKSCYNFIVEQQDIDFSQRCSIPAIINYTLSTAGRDANLKGFGVEAINQYNYSWALSRFAIEIDSLPSLGDVLSIETWISDRNRLVSTRDFVITDQSGARIASATSQWCMIDLTTRSAVDLSKIDNNHDSVIVDSPSPIERPRKINTADVKMVSQHRAAYCDIDFNRHVNTLRYIEMMLDTVSLDTLERKSRVRIDLHFANECRYGDMLNIKKLEDGSVVVFEISREDDTTAVKAKFEWL